MFCAVWPMSVSSLHSEPTVEEILDSIRKIIAEDVPEMPAVEMPSRPEYRGFRDKVAGGFSALTRYFLL
jgi:hypothetical protein